MQRAFCANCGSPDTEQVHVQWHPDAVEETRICEDCPAQYTIAYGNPHKMIDNPEMIDGDGGDAER